MKNHWINKRRSKEVQIWDFQTALGETIREKYESIYVKVAINRTINTSQNWLVVPDDRKE